MPLQLLVQVPDEGALRRLLDAPALVEVARDPDVHAFVIADGDVRPAFADRA